MKNDATILYYSSSSEDSEFEKKIQETILENCGDIPIISVTQKSTDFGTNICVGEKGASGFNMIRQILIGCYAAETRFIISAEADCLYPPDYFMFRPERDNICYRNTNTYIMGYKRKCFWKKNEGGTWAQIIGREFYIERLSYLLKGESKWDATKKNFPKEKGLKLFDEFETFETYFPCVSLKTGKGMRKFSNSERVDIGGVPYWGKGEDVFNYFIK